MAKGLLRADAFFVHPLVVCCAIEFRPADYTLARCFTGCTCFCVLFTSVRSLSSSQTSHVCCKPCRWAAGALQRYALDRSCSGISLIKGMLWTVRAHFRGCTADSQTKWQAHALKHRAAAANSSSATGISASCRCRNELYSPVAAARACRQALHSKDLVRCWVVSRAHVSASVRVAYCSAARAHPQQQGACMIDAL